MADFSKEQEEEIISFYQNYYRDEIATLAQEYPQDSESLWVDYDDVYKFDPELADDLLNHPQKIRTLFENALAQYEIPVDIDLSEATVRFHNLSQIRAIDELRDGDVDKLRSLNGQISKASAVRPVVKTAAYECTRCGTVMEIPVDTEMEEPHECRGCERQGPFNFDYHRSTVNNHQLIRVKQPPEEATNSQQHGNEIDAHIEGDLVGEAEAGSRAEIPGVLRVEADDSDPTLDFYFEAWAVDRNDDDYADLDVDEYRDEVHRLVEEENPFIELAESIAPGIIGDNDVDIETPWGETYDKYWWVRLGTGVANLFGSWRRPNGDGTFHRGSSHTLYIGDPATGKSSIMNAIENISPRSASESGKNASGPGLTAAAVKDDFGDTQWSLEAGALVKAHNGVACIDEIDKMQKDGLSRLHSALEKQRLEINKAGIDATLKCETSLLAAGNPKDSRFNKYDADHTQIDIVSSLMDRFDLVYTFKDQPDKENDRKIAESKIEEWSESGLVAKNELHDEERETATPSVPMEKLQAWVALARQEYQPVIKDDDVKERLRDFYVEIRAENDAGDDEDAPVPATVRTLDGLLRLSEASARMRMSEEVELIDAEMAIALVKVSLQDVGYDPETGQMDVDFANGRGSWSQKDRRNKILGIIESLQTNETAADPQEVVKLAVEAGIKESKAEHMLQKLKQSRKSPVYSPPDGGIRKTT